LQICNDPENAAQGLAVTSGSWQRGFAAVCIIIPGHVPDHFGAHAMKNLLLSTVLIILPVGLFAAGYHILTPAQNVQAAMPSLGDMTPFVAITTDVQSITATGDFLAAKARITNLETAWDDAQNTLRPNNTLAWGTVDGAIDAALTALRAKAPDGATVTATLAALQTALADPSAGDQGGPLRTVSGVATTDANGRALPCEVMLEQFRTALTQATIAPSDSATISTLQAKGTERCNADDDTRADDFFAQGIALMSH
jgi:hypothetical protein